MVVGFSVVLLSAYTSSVVQRTREYLFPLSQIYKTHGSFSIHPVLASVELLLHLNRIASPAAQVEHHSPCPVSEFQSYQKSLLPVSDTRLPHPYSSYSAPMSESILLMSTITPIDGGMGYPESETNWPENEHKVVSWPW
jgi:hypothetical protein